MKQLREAIALMPETRWPPCTWRKEHYDDGGTLMVARDAQGRMVAAMNPDDYEELRASLALRAT